MRSRKFGKLGVIAFGIVIACGCDLGAEDWPGWRGPRGDGISHEKTAPLRWSSTDNIAWKTPLPLSGRSSPIVWGEQVFVTAGDTANQARRVICLDKATGRILWNTEVH